MLRSARRLASVALALAVAAGLAACGSDEEPKTKKAKPSASATTEPPYLPVPKGVTLTEPGTALELGEQGVIAFQRRQNEIGVLEVNVERIERTSFEQSFPGWNVDDVTAARTPYFVRLTVTNVGDAGLGGMLLDNALWADDGTTLEAPNYYGADKLPRCPGGPLPAPFAAGATAELCQVYFIAPDRAFRNVSFPPFGGLDAITWSGELSPVSKPKKAKKGKKAGDSTESPAADDPATPAASPKPSATKKPAAKPSAKASAKATVKPTDRSTRDATSSSISKSTGGGSKGASGGASTSASPDAGGPSQAAS